MIGIYHENIAEIPVLTVVKQKKYKDALPLVVYFHGFTSAKEHNLPIAYLLAEEGYRVVLPDSHLHGEREDGTLQERQLAFWEIIGKNLKELLVIKNYFADQNLILHEEIAVSGTSMGGITTAAALATYNWISTAAILMGTPKLTAFAEKMIQFAKEQEIHIPQEQITKLFNEIEKVDLGKYPEKLNDRPVLFWHGEADDVVPYNLTYDFYQETKSFYENQADYQFIGEKKRAHKVSRLAILETVKWFSKHLSKN